MGSEIGEMIKTIRCDHCNTPVAELKDGRLLIIKAKHHGEEHMSVIELDKVPQRAKEERVWLHHLAPHG